MPGNFEKKVKKCIYCNGEIQPGKIYCPECGKLNVSSKLSKQKIKNEEIDKNERTCSGCGSIIASSKLQQCPICNTLLEKLYENLEKTKKENIGYIFDLSKSKKLEPIIQKESWIFKEGIQVFEFTLILYFVIITTIFLTFWKLGDKFEVNISTILLQLIPYCLLGMYPVCYIIYKKGKFLKLGFKSNIKLNLFAVLIGIFGGIALYITIFLSNLLLESFMILGFQGFIKYNNKVLQIRNIIQNSGIWIFLYLFLILLSTLSIEIAYRGVLHNSLKDKFNKTKHDKIFVILVVALIYSVMESLFMTFFDLYVTFFFFIINYLSFSIIGLLFEINGNIYNSLIAHEIFNLLIFISLFYS